MAAAYAYQNFDTAYGTGSTQNPFINAGGIAIGGNCTNYANQSISSGLLSLSPTALTPSELNKRLIAGKFPSSIQPNWFYACNKISDTCQSPKWRGAQTMYSFSRDLAIAKGLRMQLVTKTAVVNGAIQPLNHTLVQVGDIIFMDYNYVIGGSNSVDHTMIVTRITPKETSWFKSEQRRNYDTIHLSYQSENVRDKTLGTIWSDIWSSLFYGDKVFYVYRPTGYYR